MDLIRLTGPWKGKDKNGNGYLSGNLNAISRVMVMEALLTTTTDRGRSKNRGVI